MSTLWSTPRESADRLLVAGRVALVTGASSGIGEAFARALGARGLQLVLTGRDEGRLSQVADEIAATSDVRVERIALDLAHPDAPDQIASAVESLGLTPDILVNNAGSGLIGSFDALPLDAQLDMIRLNVEALVALTGLFLPGMLANGRGGIVNVSSAASLLPIPHFAVYSASKAFVSSFSQALWAEVRDQGVRVAVVCPGPVADTRFGDRAGTSPLDTLPALGRRRRMPREDVVTQTLAGLERGDPLVVPALSLRLLSGALGFVPRRVQLLTTEHLYRSAAADNARQRRNGSTPADIVRQHIGSQPIGPGTRAIVTGASWGIGETFARELAARGADLLLVARTEDRLRVLADELREQHGARVETVAADLAAPDGPRRLVEAAEARSFEPTLLVNNAGVGVLGPFADLSVEKAREMVRLNVLALTDLTYCVLAGMLARGSGAIINVGSASAFQPLPNYGVYAATKSFVASFSAALWAECRGRGVRVVAVCPGAVDAGAPDEAAVANGSRPRRRLQLRRKVTREEVVANALVAVERNRPVVLPGAPPRIVRLGLGLVPRRARLRLTGMLLHRFPTMLTGIRRRDP